MFIVLFYHLPAKQSYVRVLSRVQLFGNPWTVAHQAPLPMGFSRQEHWSGLPFPTPEDIPDPRIEAASLVSPSLSGEFFIISATWEALSRDKAGRKEMRSLSLWGLCSKV